jgi:cytidyltransferase-like protein
VPTYGRAVLGGTFDHLHAGHAALLSAAFRAGRSVAIGVTTDRYLAEHPKPAGGRLQSYATRRRALVRWLVRHYPGRSWRTSPLSNRFGRSVEPGVDVLVVSVDTVGGGRAVNAERRRRGRPVVPVVVVPVVLADDLGPISSRRIRSGAIDRDGRRRSPIRIGLGVSDPADAPPAIRAIRTAFPTARVRVAKVPRPGSERSPNRLARQLARRAIEGRELALGVARIPRGGWCLVERSAAVELAVRAVPPGTPSTLEQASLAQLRPART